MMEGVNSTMIYGKNFCKCHMYPQYNNNMIIKKGKKTKQKNQTLSCKFCAYAVSAIYISVSY
jgi:hypothetical protein